MLLILRLHVVFSIFENLCGLKCLKKCFDLQLYMWFLMQNFSKLILFIHSKMNTYRYLKFVLIVNTTIFYT